MCLMQVDSGSAEPIKQRLFGSVPVHNSRRVFCKANLEEVRPRRGGEQTLYCCCCLEEHAGAGRILMVIFNQKFCGCRCCGCKCCQWRFPSISPVQPLLPCAAAPALQPGALSRALQEAGHDPSAPTAWLAEGLLGYLSRATHLRLFTWVQIRDVTVSYSAGDVAPCMM
jgi:hypothetical protein